jgi:TPR repeat protein
LGNNSNRNFIVGKNLNKAISYYTNAADLSNSYAMLNLGIIYYEQKNFNLAMKWLKKAAKLNNWIAQYNIAIIYFNGNKDKSALKYFKLLVDNKTCDYSSYIDKARDYIKTISENT